jgi:RNA polymerase sigma-70 factor (ECF subfamily)
LAPGRKFERRASVASWLLAIAKNRALSMRQEHRRREEALDDDYAATLVDHSDTTDMVREQQDGAKVLRRLTVARDSEYPELDQVSGCRDGVKNSKGHHARSMTVTE